jgi:GTP-binding protein Era
MGKSAFAAIIARPSAGKSTLLNTLCGYKVSIVSPVPQTTRHTIRGIVTRPAGQLVFVDTPGLHKSEKKLNLRLRAAALRTISESDLTLYIIDASRELGVEEAAAAELVAGADPGGERTVIAINKSDLKPKLPAAITAFIEEKLPMVDSGRICRISALTGEGIEALLEALFSIAPEGNPYYDSECYTDQEVAFRVAEIIREKCIEQLRDELPHCVHVEVEDIELQGEGAAKTLWVRAVIFTERESQKGMIVGKGGALIKKIRLAALKELRPLFDWKLSLDLRVKAVPGWRKNEAILKTFV